MRTFFRPRRRGSAATAAPPVLRFVRRARRAGRAVAAAVRPGFPAQGALVDDALRVAGSAPTQVAGGFSIGFGAAAPPPPPPRRGPPRREACAARRDRPAHHISFGFARARVASLGGGGVARSSPGWLCGGV